MDFVDFSLGMFPSSRLAPSAGSQFERYGSEAIACVRFAALVVLINFRCLIIQLS